MAKKVEMWKVGERLFETEMAANSFEVTCNMERELVKVSPVFGDQVILRTFMSNAHVLWPLLKKYAEENR